MKRFLSVDWDYFIGATAIDRLRFFPDGGNENLPDSLRDYIWDSHYIHPELREMKVIPEYKDFLNLCKNFRGECMIADSHKHAFDFIMDNTSPDEEFVVYNIDFHHDLYDYKTSNGERVNCGNWVTVLREERPNMKYIWIRRDDSDISTTGGVKVKAEFMPFSVLLMTIRNNFDGLFDYLYLCRSAVWSPPHLDDKFIRVVKTLLNKSYYAQYEKGIDKPRPYDIPNDFGMYNALASIAEEARKGLKD